MANIILFAGILLLIYFSHLFSLLMILIWLGVSSGMELFTSRPSLWKRRAYLFALIPTCALAVGFMKGSAETTPKYREAAELLTWIVDARPIITLNYEKQQYFSLIAGLGILLLFIYLLITRFKERAIRTSDSFLLLAIFCLLGYFILPDEAATGGFVSIRFLQMFFFLLLIWMSCRLPIRWPGLLLAGILLLVSFRMLWFHLHEMQRLSSDVEKYHAAAAQIPEGAIVLPLNYSGNWLHANISSYVGAESNALVLDNYEASKPHFPLRWKAGRESYDILGRFSASIPPCGDPSTFRARTSRDIDYVISWKRGELSDSCTSNWDRWLEMNYETVQTNDPDLRIYKYRK